MSFKSTMGHLLNDISELISGRLVEGYTLNMGVDRGLSVTYYGERLVEIPFVFRHIRDPPKSIIDIGCSESITPIQLAMLGYKVTGVDMREYKYKHENFKFIKSDFLDFNFKNNFDVALAISSIEHFGLTTYKNKALDLNADKKAIDKIYSILKPKGQFIFTAPFGIKRTIKNYERIYDSNDIKIMLNKFKIQNILFYKVVKHKLIEEITRVESEKIDYKYDNYSVVLINAIKK